LGIDIYNKLNNDVYIIHYTIILLCCNAILHCHAPCCGAVSRVASELHHSAAPFGSRLAISDPLLRAWGHDVSQFGTAGCGRVAFLTTPG
jgi:hypothetical protein